MESKKRLIDANALVEDLEAAKANNGMGAVVASTLIRYVKLCHTVDAVEVVRCEACKQWCRNAGIVDSPNGHCFCHDIDTNQFDFCSYGERRAE